MLTIRSSRSRFAARLNSGVTPHGWQSHAAGYKKSLRQSFCAGFMWLVARPLPGFMLNFALNDALAIVLAAAGLLLNVYPKFLFKRAGTSVNPMNPGAATSLVTTWIYRHTRNPMYVGHVLILLGWALHLDNALLFLAVPIHVLYIAFFQIHPEERVLSARFPDEFDAYCKVAPRWV